jgi:hypothetical protein
VDGIGFRDIFLRNVKFISVCGSMEHSSQSSQSSQEGATRTGFDPLRHVVCSMHTPRSEAQPKTATRIHLPIHLGSTLMKKIGGSPLSRAQGRVQRRILRRSRLGPEARQNMNNVYVRLLRRARTENKPPRLALLPLLKDEEGRWPRPVSVCGSIGSGSNFACSSLSSLSRLSLARSLARSLHPHKRTPTHTRLHTHTTENVGHGIAERGHRA